MDIASCANYIWSSSIVGIFAVFRKSIFNSILSGCQFPDRMSDFFPQAKYVLEEEAKIHQTIRQNHPNLLGAMAIIKLDTPRSVCDSQKPIHGYILMERGGMKYCALFVCVLVLMCLYSTHWHNDVEICI